MATIKVHGEKEFEVPEGTKLVLALEDNGIDISHRCGGNAKCTTCRCRIESGEPSRMTRAERQKLDESIEKGDNSIEGTRLACQIVVEGDMTVVPLMRVRDMKWDDPGSRPKDHITPDPEWI